GTARGARGARGRGAAPSRARPAVVAHRSLDTEAGMDGPPWTVFMRDGGAEKRHHAVARVLVDRALEPGHLGGDKFEEPVDDGVHVLRVELLSEARESREVGKEHRDLAALALESGAALEDLVSEMPRGIAVRRARRSAGCGGNGMSARMAE